MIYDFNYKSMSKAIWSFNKTLYGKCMFVICYMTFILFFLLSIYLLTLYFIKPVFSIALVLFILTPITIISFAIGSFGYYNEVNKFVTAKNIEVVK